MKRTAGIGLDAAFVGLQSAVLQFTRAIAPIVARSWKKMFDSTIDCGYNEFRMLLGGLTIGKKPGNQ